MLDPRIGEYSGEEPLVCAMSGEPVRGRHSSQYALDKEHYYRVLGKREGDFSWREAVETELRALIASAAQPAPEAPAKSGKASKSEVSDVRSE